MRTISFKVTEDEERRIRQLARHEHLSLSEFLRRRAAGAKPDRAIGKVRCKFTGAEIFSPLPEALPLTTESVREMLADFP